jgi:hypothetical protein
VTRDDEPIPWEALKPEHRERIARTLAEILPGADPAEHWAKMPRAEQLESVIWHDEHPDTDAGAWEADRRELAERHDPETVECLETLPAERVAHLEAVFRDWLVINDLVPLRAVLGAVASHLLGDDALALCVIGPSGSLKTVIAESLSRVPGVVPSSLVKGPAALLSGTPRKERSKSSTGGLLREIGDSGVLVLKDFTSLLSLQRDARAELLAAFREILDGAWTRQVGTEGGRRLVWHGRCSIIAASTTALDSAHGVLATLGNRFMVVRTGGESRADVGRRAMANSGNEEAMRAALAGAVGELFAHPLRHPPLPGDEVLEEIVRVADVVSLGRSPVERDFNGEISLVGDSDTPARAAKVLLQVRRGMLALGYSPDQARETLLRVAGDSLPKLRRLVYRALAHGRPMTTTAVAQTVDHPTRSARRALEDLVAHGVAVRESSGQGRADNWRLTDQARSVAGFLFRHIGPIYIPGSPDPTLPGTSPPPISGAPTLPGTSPPPISGDGGDGGAGGDGEP